MTANAFLVLGHDLIATANRLFKPDDAEMELAILGMDGIPHAVDLPGDQITHLEIAGLVDQIIGVAQCFTCNTHSFPSVSWMALRRSVPHLKPAM